jgi:hypothetical protein
MILTKKEAMACEKYARGIEKLSEKIAEDA